MKAHFVIYRRLLYINFQINVNKKQLTQRCHKSLYDSTVN